MRRKRILFLLTILSMVFQWSLAYSSDILSSPADFLVLESNGKVELQDGVSKLTGEINKKNLDFILSDDGQTWAIKYENDISSDTNNNVVVKIFNNTSFNRVQTFSDAYKGGKDFLGPYLSPEGGHWGWSYYKDIKTEKGENQRRCFLKKDFTVYGGQYGFKECGKLYFAPKGDKWLFQYKDNASNNDWKVLIDGYAIDLRKASSIDDSNLNIEMSDIVFSPDGQDLAFWFGAKNTKKAYVYLTYQKDDTALDKNNIFGPYYIEEDVDKLASNVKYVGNDSYYKYVILASDPSDKSGQLISNLSANEKFNFNALKACKFKKLSDFAYPSNYLDISKEKLNKWGFKFEKLEILDGKKVKVKGVYLSQDAGGNYCGKIFPELTESSADGDDGSSDNKVTALTGPSFSPLGNVFGYGLKSDKRKPWIINIIDNGIEKKFTCAACMYDNIINLKFSNDLNNYWGFIGEMNSSTFLDEKTKESQKEPRIFQGLKALANLGTFSEVNSFFLNNDGDMLGLTYKEKTNREQIPLAGTGSTRKGVIILDNKIEGKNKIKHYGPYVNVKALTFSKASNINNNTFWGFAFEEDKYQCLEEGDCWGAMINGEKYLSNSTLVDIKEINGILSVGRIEIPKQFSEMNKEFAATYSTKAPYRVCNLSNNFIHNSEFMSKDIISKEENYISFDKKYNSPVNMCDPSVKDSQVSWGKLFFEYIDISEKDQLSLVQIDGISPVYDRSMLDKHQRLNNVWIDFKANAMPLKVVFSRPNVDQENINYKGYKITKVAYVPAFDNLEKLSKIKELHIGLTQWGVDHNFFNLSEMKKLDLSFINKTIDFSKGRGDLTLLDSLENLILVGTKTFSTEEGKNVLRNLKHLKTLIISEETALPNIFLNELKKNNKDLSIYKASLLTDQGFRETSIGALKLFIPPKLNQRLLISKHWFRINEI